jgi:hypothetical protein
MELAEINFWPILVATIVNFLLGFLWYGPMFGKPWQRLTRLSDDDLKNGNMAMVFGPVIILMFIMGLVLASILPGDSNWLDGLLLGAVLGMGISMTSLGVNFLFARRSLTLFLINGIYMLLVMMIFGAIIGGWYV